MSWFVITDLWGLQLYSMLEEEHNKYIHIGVCVEYICPGNHCRGLYQLLMFRVSKETLAKVLRSDMGGNQNSVRFSFYYLP
jgi:hypothetical protein